MSSDQPVSEQPVSGTELPEVALDFPDVSFRLRVFDDPSGLRGQVFAGEEKIAGVQVFHTKDVEKLLWKARRDRAVLRGVAQRTAA